MTAAGSSEAPIAQQLAEFAVEQSRPGRLPREVRDSVLQRLLDTLGICFAASSLDTSEAIRGYVQGQGGRPEASAVGLVNRVPAALAALVNGTLAHSLDFDDTHLPSVLHPSASVVPAALAACEMQGADGRRVVAAVAVGLEICVRVGMAGYDEARRNSLFFDRGQHATSICGAIGGAAAASVAMGMSASQLADAMGVAASMASGIIESNRTGGNVKRLHCGWAAHAAVTAASLVRAGFTASPTVFEGRFGFFEAFLSGRYDRVALLGGLGERWEVPGIFFKPYPANHFTHCGIDAAIALRRRGLRAKDVSSLELAVAKPTVPTIGEPIKVKRSPTTGYQAQFSGPYTVVAALLGGGGLGVGLDDFTDELAVDPRRRALMARVTVRDDTVCSEIFPDQFPAILLARTNDGHELREEVLFNRGGPRRPLSGDEIVAKFRDNVRQDVP